MGRESLCGPVCPPQAPTPRQARLRRQPAWPPGSQERPPPTCAVDHTGRLDGAVLRLHSGHAAHPEVIRPHADATHWAVLDHLATRGAASRAQQGSVRVPTAPNVTGSPPPRRDLVPCSCWARVLRHHRSGVTPAPEANPALPDLEDASPDTRGLSHKVTSKKHGWLR